MSDDLRKVNAVQCVQIRMQALLALVVSASKTATLLVRHLCTNHAPTTALSTTCTTHLWTWCKPTRRLIVLHALNSFPFHFHLFVPSLFISRTRYTRKPLPQSSQRPADLAPPVSILRPLKGVDNNLRDNLESTFTQNYPRFEIVFSVVDGTDPAVHVVRELMERYPHVEAKLLVSEY